MEPNTLKDAMALRDRSISRVKGELTRIMSSNPTILGIDGEPMEESKDRVVNEILALAHKYLQAPTMDEQVILPGLQQNTIEGASLSLMSLLTATIFEPVAHTVPPMAQMIPQMYMYLLGYMVEKQTIPQNGLSDLVDEVASLMDLKAKDGNGRDLVMGDEIQNLKRQACNELLVILASQSVSMGFMAISEDSLSITPQGDRLFRHMISVNKWISDVQSAIVGKESLIVQP